MDRNIKVRVIVPFNGIKEQKYFPSNHIMYLDCERAKELLKLGYIKIMEIRKCKYE